MRVLVFGNINSGKSFAIAKMKRLFPHYDVISIDDMRRRYGDGSLEGEELARNMFVGEAVKAKDAFIETTGVGWAAFFLLEELKPRSFIIIYVAEGPDICIERISAKEFSATPYPWPDESKEGAIRNIDAQFKSGMLKRLWKDRALDIIEVNNESELLSIPFAHYDDLIQNGKKRNKEM